MPTTLVLKFEGSKSEERLWPVSAEPQGRGFLTRISEIMSHTHRGGEAMEAMLVLLAKGSCGGGLSAILWVIAVVLVIAGIVTLFRGGLLAGIALIVVGLLIGPGGVSIFC
jgi:hypothetical protein